MHSRSYRCWRTPLLVLSSVLLTIAPFVALAAGSDPARQNTSTSAENASNSGANQPSSAIPVRKAPLYPRSVSFWGRTGMPEYGGLSPEDVESPDAITFSAGSFLTSGRGLAFPAELKAAETPTGPAYFVVQFRASALEPGEIERSLKAIAATGAALIEYVPNNAYIVKTSPASYPGLVASGLLQYVAPYHPGYKIARDMGMAPLPDPELALSSVYRLYVRGFPDVAGADLEAQIKALGGRTFVSENAPDGPNVIAELDNTQIIPLARIEGVRDIQENIPVMLNGEENSSDVVIGTYSVNAALPKLYSGGVNGSGGYQRDVDLAPPGAGSPPVAGANDTDWNGNGILDNGAQIIAIADTGMAVDAGDFAETAAGSGWIGGASCTVGQGGGTAGPNVNVFPSTALHRKIAWYYRAPGGFGAGDLCSCDPGPSHGTVTTAQAAGNASSGPFAAQGIDWSGDGAADDYGAPFLFTSGPNTFRVDGVAYGARMVFQDTNGTCPEPETFTPGVYNTLLTDGRAKGARIGSLSFGAFNGTSTLYDANASSIDTFLSTDANRDYMVFLAAGNAGIATANTNGFHKPLTLTNESSAKDAVTIGGNNSGNANALNALYFQSSIGPAPNGTVCSSLASNGGAVASNCGRIKPDLIAPASDGNLGLQESFNCGSSDVDQQGPVVCRQIAAQTGTSFAAPNAAGAGALVRDYFASGLYPDGTSSNSTNNADRKAKVSGALVKALLVASAQHMNTGNTKYDHRYNPEEGYGYVNLRNALPLVDDPATPSGLIVHDAGTPAGVTGPSNISLPLTLGPGTSATATFSVLNATQPLKVALAWVEGQGQTLVNNLDLELRYCGPDGNCTTNGGVCVGGGNPGTACTYGTPITTCTLDAGNPPVRGQCNGDRVYYGNVFTGDVNDDGTVDFELSGDGTFSAPGTEGHWRDEGPWSLANRDANLNGTAEAGDAVAPRDTRNTLEAVFLSNDPEADGSDASHNSDTQLATGLWQVKITHPAVGTDLQKYALVIAGGVTVDSSIRIDTNPLSCNGDLGILVQEVAQTPAVDPGCNTSSCLASVISGRVHLVVKTPAGATVDCEDGLTFTKDPNALGFVSQRIPVSTAVDGNPSCLPCPTDAILLAADGYTITATYNDVVSGSPSPKSTFATFSCVPNVDFFAIGQVGRDQKFLMAGGCDTDTFMDNGETFTYRARFANNDAVLTLEDVDVTLRAVVPDNDNATDPGRLNNALSPYVSIPTPLVHIDKVSPGALEDAAFTVSVSGSPSWGGAADPPPVVEMVVGVRSQKAGKTADHYQVFSHLLNGENEEFLYSTDYPTGATVDRDRIGDDRADQNDERIDNPIHDTRNPFPVCPGGFRSCSDLLNETTVFGNMTNTAFGGGNPAFNGPWDFDTNDEGFRSGLYPSSSGNGPDTTNWGEDHDYDNHLSGPYVCRENPGQGCTCPAPGICIGGTNAGGACTTNANCPGGGVCAPEEGCNDVTCPQATCIGGTNAGNPCLTNANCPGVGGFCPKRCMHQEDFDGNQDGTLNENWSLTGACGWVSSNGASKGGWHTGTIGPAPPANCTGFGEANCESFDILPGSSAINFWWEFVRTPIITKVHPNFCQGGTNNGVLCTSSTQCTGGGTCKVSLVADPRGLDYRFELRRWAWNMNADYQAFNATFTWEFDEDTDSLDPVDLNDGTILRSLSNGVGPISTGNVNLTRGFPIFVQNDPDGDGDGTNDGPFGQKNGVSTAAPNRNRTADRSCFFQALNSAAANILLRAPLPQDDDCDNDIVNLGADGCPGLCGVDDDADNATDNPEEACPCFKRINAIDEDHDGRIDEADERQRFYRCSGATTTFCNVTGINLDDCAGTGPCGHFGDGKPKPYGDDSCGDGSVDESLQAAWTSAALSSELGHRLGQTQNWNIEVLNGPTLRLQTLEDVYDREAGNRVQGAFGFLVFEGSNGNPAVQSYGAAFDDVTVEWAELHPIQQTGAKGCGGGICDSLPGSQRAGKLCFNNDDCGAGHTCAGATASATSSCAALSWGTNNLFAGSGVVALNLVDFNASTTQGTFSCTRYGFTAGCGGGNCAASNDCDNDGFGEVEATVTSSSESNAEFFRLEQTATGSPNYTALVKFSSALSAANDGVSFLQYNGASNPTVTAVYFDKDSGSADVNADGTPDSPPNNGKDKCSGFCGFDDNKNATGPDHRPGGALFNDDDNGACDFKANNAGAPCVTNAQCPGGNCLTIDEPDELCGRTCTAGTTSGLCSASSGNVGTVCTAPGTPSTCTGGGTCVAINCNTSAECGTGGNCPGICYNGTNNGLACTTLAGCTSGAVGGFCGRAAAWGDDLCSNIDESGEQCAVVANRLVSGIDDNCGCSQNPLTAVLNAVYDTADLIVQSFAFSDNFCQGGTQNGQTCPPATCPGGTCGDADGFADDNELVGLKLTLRNVGTVDVDDVRVRISSQSAEIACINDPTAAYGRINALCPNPVDCPSVGGNLDALQFTVANVNRTTLNSVKQATITVTITGTSLLPDGTKVPIEGTSTPQNFTFDLDLDSSTAPPVATTTKIYSFESSQYATGAAWDADWFHTFVSDHDGLHCQYNDPSGALARSAPVGCFLRQDPGTQVPDDWHLHATVTGGLTADGGRDSGSPGTCSGGKTPGGVCSQNQDCFGGCTGAHAGANCNVNADCTGTCSNDALVNCTGASRCRFCNNDHSITCVTSSACSAVGGSCGTAGTCNGIGTCTNPAPGTCAGVGSACMHDGAHLGAFQLDAVHLDNIFYTHLRVPVQIGLGRPGTDDPPVLDWWQQVSLIDDRNFSNLSPPYTLGRGVAHILTDRNNNGVIDLGPPTDPLKDGFWEKVKPYFGAPRQQSFPAGNCTYDPDDDGNNEDDLDNDLTFNNRAKGPSSTCFPEFVWACVGDTIDPADVNPSLGNVAPTAICFPEVDSNDAPIVRQGTGRGRWVEAKVDLSKYKGRKIWFRYLETELQFGTAFLFDPTTGLGGSRDNGWYVDDIHITGTSAPFALKADTDTPPTSSCPSVLCGNPDALVPRFTGSTYLTLHDGTDNDGNGVTDEPDEGASVTVQSDAPLRNIDLNGQDTPNSATSGTCINGVLQYRYWADRDGNGTFKPDNSELIRDFLENPRATANSLCTEHIKMDVRCSSAPAACAPGPADLLVVVSGKIGPMNSVRIPSLGTMTWSLTENTQASGYDVAYKRISTALFDGDFSTFASPAGGACPAACNLPGASYNIGCKPTLPVGSTDMWLVRSRGGLWVSSWDEGGSQAHTRDSGTGSIPASVCP